MKKALNVRIDENTVNRMKYYCAELGKSEADFMAAAIENYCNALRLERSGGMSLSIPNPQIITASAESKSEALAILSTAAHELTKNESGLEFGLHYIAGFAVERLYRDTEEQRKAFSEKLTADK